ncbi:unnamed protein product [Phyllotreta striolata]|uniref:Dysbindin protein homolog n=1 Tax=Phyllotreta striolata TaxID=444603 RepID=A0A9N9TPD2_PHYSR|nr:unnamed protein product [Phyllotreta striolata]
MLSSLKEKILNVTLFNTEEQQIKRNPVNINAGAELLAHFQNQWEDLHELNEKNAAEAAKAAGEIEKITKFVNDNKMNIALINHILSNSNLIKNIDKCTDTIQDLYGLSENLEKQLVELEVLIDQTNFEKLKNRHRYHLEQYEKRKEESFEKYKTELEKKHLKKVEEYEASKKALMQERQQVFQDAFKTDIEMYKNLGTVPSKINSNQNGALLEEIQLDFDQSELDQFFNDEENK